MMTRLTIVAIAASSLFSSIAFAAPPTTPASLPAPTEQEVQVAAVPAVVVVAAIVAGVVGVSGVARAAVDMRKSRAAPAKQAAAPAVAPAAQPVMAKVYPRCSKTVRDSCSQSR